jgi:putative two-component system response regulator
MWTQMKETSTRDTAAVVVGPAESLDAATQLLPPESGDFETYQAPEPALRHLRRDPRAGVLIIAPGEEISRYIELCRSVKFDRRTRLVAILVILKPDHASHSLNFLKAGADDCVSLSASSEELHLRLQRALRTKEATNTLDDAESVITALATAIEGKDECTCGHVDRVSSYCTEVGRRLGVPPTGLTTLHTGGLVHDIGKVMIPDQILNKPGKLTPEEMSVMQRHPVIGYEILEPLRTFADVLPLVRWHHERPNGTGYPDKIGGSDLLLLPRIVAVADVFDALSTDRPYRKAFPVSKCAEILKDMAGRGELDESVVATLMEIVEIPIETNQPHRLSA